MARVLIVWVLGWLERRTIIEELDEVIFITAPLCMQRFGETLNIYLVLLVCPSLLVRSRGGDV